MIAKAATAPTSTVLVASSSESDSDDVLTPLSKLAEKKSGTNQHARNGNDIGDIPLALLKKLRPIWKVGDENGKGTTVDFSCSAGEMYHKAILARWVTLSPLIENFVQERVYLEKLPGQVVLNASIYSTILAGTGAYCGPPCLFVYPTMKYLQDVRGSLFGFLWQNGFGCTTRKTHNKVYPVIRLAPDVPLGRVTFVVSIDESNDILVNEHDRDLIKRVAGWSTLLDDQKSAIWVLLSHKYSLMERSNRGKGENSEEE